MTVQLTPSSLLRVRTDDDRRWRHPLCLLASVDEVPGRHPPPIPDSPLQGPQQPLGILAGILL